MESRGDMTHRKTPGIDIPVLFCDLTYTQEGVSSDPMPQAVGGLATFASTQLEFASRPAIFKYPDVLAAYLEKERGRKVIGLSNYVWNSSLSLSFAKHIKAAEPDSIVIMGGPNFPLDREEQQAFLKRHPEIDFYIAKEAEIPLVALLQRLAEARWDIEAADVHGAFSSVFSLDKFGTLHAPAAYDRLTDLTSIPSPYTRGWMDEFFDGKLLPVITTNRGCPFSCTFCQEGIGYYSKVYKSSRQRVREELHYIGALMKDVVRAGGRNELLVTDSNFAMFAEDEQTCADIAECYELYGWPDNVHATSGKNRRERIVTSIRRAKGLIPLSAAVQSLDEEVLQNVKRDNIDTDQLIEVAFQAHGDGTPVYSDVVLGLPGDSTEKHRATLKKLIDAGIEKINMFDAMLLSGCEMATPESRARFGMIGQFRIMPRCFGSFSLFGKDFRAAELDEVCVQSNTLSFEDYVECRVLDLGVHIFHNGSMLPAFHSLLRHFNISAMDWITDAIELPVEDTLSAVFDSFRKAMRTGYWKSEEEAAAAVQTMAPETAGTASNFLHAHRAMALSSAWDDVVGRAVAAAGKVIARNGVVVPAALLGDVAKHDRLLLCDLFKPDSPSTVDATFTYDVVRHVDWPAQASIDALAAPQAVAFHLSPDARTLAAEHLNTFGRDLAGVARMLGRMNTVYRLFRRPVPVREGVAAEVV
jgi:radical SAM superfamily enzyme YgiQ (UPF0313 family)